MFVRSVRGIVSQSPCRNAASAGDLLLLADAEDDELGRLHRSEADLDDELALVDRLRRIRLRVALDVVRLIGGGAEQGASGPQSAEEAREGTGHAFPQGDV